MLHGAGIFTHIWVVFGANVGKYSSTMEHMDLNETINIINGVIHDGCLWIFMDIHGCLWIFMDVYGYLWIFIMDIYHGYLWDHLIEVSRELMDMYGI